MIVRTRVGWKVNMCPCVGTLIITTTLYTKIVVGRPYILRNGKGSGVTQKIYVRDDSLEIIVMFESGYPDINICKYVSRQ